MIVVNIEVWPRGDESKKYPIAKAFIANEGTTTEKTAGEYGSYTAKFMQSEQFNPHKVWKVGVADRVHRRNRGVWDILYLCLKSAGMDRRNER